MSFVDLSLSVAKASGLNATKPPEGGCGYITLSYLACFSRLDALQPDDLSSGHDQS